MSLKTRRDGAFNTIVATEGIFHEIIADIIDASGGGSVVFGDITVDNITVKENIFLAKTTATTGQIIQNGTITFSTFGTNNLFLGADSGNLTVTGNCNIGIGPLALDSVTTGISNIAIGCNALDSLTTGSTNIGIGTLALASQTTGDSNVAVGHQALNLSTTGKLNTALGFQSLGLLDTGASNTAIGSGTATDLTSGTQNVAVGSNSLQSVTTGTNNVALGFQSLKANLTTATDNTALGANTGVSGNFKGTISLGSGAIAAKDGDWAIGSAAFPMNPGGVIDTTAVKSTESIFILLDGVNVYRIPVYT